MFLNFSECYGYEDHESDINALFNSIFNDKVSKQKEIHLKKDLVYCDIATLCKLLKKQEKNFKISY